MANDGMTMDDMTNGTTAPCSDRSGARSDRLRISVALVGREGGGIRRFLLTQLAHASEHGLDFEYSCLQAGAMHDALRDAGAEVFVVGGDVPDVARHGPIAAFARWFAPGGGWGATRRLLLDHLRTRRPDCAYTHLLPMQMACGWATRRLGVPHVGQLHGTLNPRRMLGLTRAAYSRALAKSLDAIVVVSDSARSSLRGAALAKSRRVYNGIDTAAIERSLPPSAKQPGRVIVCGRLTPGKKVETAIRALPIVLATRPDVRLEIVGGPTGDDPYFRSLAESVRTLGLEDRVTFTGPIDPPYARIAGAEVCVNCSTVEGLPYVVLESMVCGTAVIVADCGSPAELVENERTGLHFRADDESSLAETVVRLLQDAKLRRRLVETAREHARQSFDIGVHLGNLRAVFEQCRFGRGR